MFERLIELAREYTALASFFSIFAAGMIFTLFSLVFGGDHDHGDVGHDAHGDHGGDQGPNIFSIRGISLMATGFGAMSCIVMYFTNRVLVASVAGLAFGWVFAFIGVAMLRIFIRQQASSMIRPEGFIGAFGEVTTGIPQGGLGEVRLTIDGTTMTRTARSVRGEYIPSGRTVRVVHSGGGSVSVEEVSGDVVSV